MAWEPNFMFYIVAIQSGPVWRVSAGPVRLWFTVTNKRFVVDHESVNGPGKTNLGAVDVHAKE